MADYGNNMYDGGEAEAEFMQSNGFCDTFHVVEEARNGQHLKVFKFTNSAASIFIELLQAQYHLKALFKLLYFNHLLLSKTSPDLESWLKYSHFLQSRHMPPSTLFFVRNKKRLEVKGTPWLPIFPGGAGGNCAGSCIESLKGCDLIFPMGDREFRRLERKL
ncbi:hypothetical protein B9Z19DRAFT_1064086 [Tuber borchii]|uniref:Uncharacterized protein n=1 Tax=Tuber borchii TaxID=42251 RepID=A0A2T6ZW12_TUBBO|nr:hypothetical protein B9Z19DRAFT_1064086 [Tuber borchii]